MTVVGLPGIHIECISTHTPLAGRDENLLYAHTAAGISTHTPLAGRDEMRAWCNSNPTKFLLTRPLRDVTSGRGSQTNKPVISTHTPLAGRDSNATR